MNKKTFKGIVFGMIIMLMLSISITSFAQIKPEGYPPSIADEIQEQILNNFYMYDKDMSIYVYSKLLDYNWSLLYDTYTFLDGSIIVIKYERNVTKISNGQNEFLYIGRSRMLDKL